jgi:O-antigen ligase
MYLKGCNFFPYRNQKMKITEMLFSLTVSGIVVLSVVNVFPSIFDYPRTSALLSVSFATAVVGLLLAFCKIRTSLLLLPDAVALLFAVVSIATGRLNNSLKITGIVCLILLYAYLRLNGRLNYLLLYFSVLTACIVLASTGYLQYGGLLEPHDKMFRFTGPFYNPAPFGGMLAVLLGAVFAVFMLGQHIRMSEKMKYLSGSVLLFSLPALAFSGSRGAWGAFAASLIFTLMLKYYRRLKRLPRKYKIMLLVTMLAGITVVGCLLFQLKPASAKGRLLIWKISTQMIAHKPLWGFGRDGFEAKYMHYQAAYFRSNKASPEEKYLAGNNYLAYNEPIRIAVEYGIVGALLYSLYWFFIFFRTKHGCVVAAACKSSLIAGFIFGLFSYPNQVFSLQLITVIAVACLLNRQKRNGIVHQLHPVWQKAIVFLLSSAFLAATFKQYALCHQAQQFMQSRHKIEKLERFSRMEKLADKMQGNTWFMFACCSLLQQERGQCDSLLLETLTTLQSIHPQNDWFIIQGDCYLRTKRYKEAEVSYWQAHYMAPSMQRARTKIALLYHTAGRKKDAQQLAKEILGEPVKIYGFETYRLHQELELMISDISD